MTVWSTSIWSKPLMDDSTLFNEKKGRSGVTFPINLEIMRSYPDDPLKVSNRTSFIDPKKWYNRPD